MTIIVKGHIKNLSQCAMGIGVTIQLEAARGGEIFIETMPSEATGYFPGMGVEVHIRPGYPPVRAMLEHVIGGVK